MSVGEERIARRYAKALFDVCDKDARAAIATGLEGLATTWQENSELRGTLLNPAFHSNERETSLIEIARLFCSNNPSFENFVKILFANNRISLISPISKIFTELLDQANDNLSIEIISAVELNESERREVSDQINSELRHTTSIRWDVDPTLIGGMVVKLKDKVLDGSVKGSLAKLRSAL